MWKGATDWRESFGVGHRVMGRFGTGATYAVRGGGLAVSPPYPPDGVSGDGIAGGAGSKTFCAVGGVSNCSSSSSSNQTAKEKKAGATEADKALEAFGAAVGGAVGVTSTAGTWAWQRNQSQNGHTTTANDTLEGFAEETCFYGRLKKDDPRDGAPVAVWRLGVVDWSGVAREGAQTEVISVRQSAWIVQSVLVNACLHSQLFSFRPNPLAAGNSSLYRSRMVSCRISRTCCRRGALRASSGSISCGRGSSSMGRAWG